MLHFLVPFYDCVTSCISVWLWHFLGPLYDCETYWCRFPVSLYDCGTSWVSLLVWHFLMPLRDGDTSSGPFMIATLPRSSLWLWHFFGLLNDHDTSWGLQMIVTLRHLYDSDTSWDLYDCCTFTSLFINVLHITMKWTKSIKVFGNNELLKWGAQKRYTHSPSTTVTEVQVKL